MESRDQEYLYNVVRFYATELDEFREQSYGKYKYKGCAIKKANQMKNGCVVMYGDDIVYPTSIPEILMTIAPELVKD